MNRRILHRCLVWLLPLLVAHSLVPTGFMVAAGNDGLELAFCPVQSASIVEVLGAATHDHSQHHTAHAAHHDGTHDQHASSSATDHSQHARTTSCPFALAGTPMLAAAAPTLFFHSVPADHPLTLDSSTSLGRLLFERNRIRGPPHLV